MSYDKKFRVVKSFDSSKGVLRTGTIVTFPNEQLAEHHLNFGYVEPASFEAPKKRILNEVTGTSKSSTEFKVSEAVNMLSGMNISQARNFAADDARKGVKKALAELIQVKSEKRRG